MFKLDHLEISGFKSFVDPVSVKFTGSLNAIVVITDGYDEHSEASVEEAVQAVQEAQATLYVIGVGGVAGISLRGRHGPEGGVEAGERRKAAPRQVDIGSLQEVRVRMQLHLRVCA